jgi:transposase
MSFSLDGAVPVNHLVRRLAAVVDFDFVRGLVRREYSHTGQPSVDPIVLFKLWLLGYLFNITSERRLCEEASLNLAWRWFLGYELDEPLPDYCAIIRASRCRSLRDFDSPTASGLNVITRSSITAEEACRARSISPNRT